MAHKEVDDEASHEPSRPRRMSFNFFFFFIFSLLSMCLFEPLGIVLEYSFLKLRWCAWYYRLVDVPLPSPSHFINVGCSRGMLYVNA